MTIGNCMEPNLGLRRRMMGYTGTRSRTDLNYLETKKWTFLSLLFSMEGEGSRQYFNLYKINFTRYKGHMYHVLLLDKLNVDSPFPSYPFVNCSNLRTIYSPHRRINWD